MATTAPDATLTKIDGRMLARPERLAAAIIGLVVIALVASAWLYWRSLKLITIVIDGQEQVVYSRAGEIEQLWAQIDYRPRPEDRLAMPAGGLTDGVRVIIERARPTLITADGDRAEAWTHATTAGDLLTEQGILFGENDRLWLQGRVTEPASTLPPAVWQGEADGRRHPAWRQTASPLWLSIERAAPVLLMDGNQAPIRFETLATTVGEALAAAGIPVYEGDAVFPPLGSRVQAGQRLVIWRSLPIEVQADGRRLSTRTRQETVGDALAEMGVALVGLDRVAPPLHARLRPHTQIRVTRVREDVVYEEQHLPFQVVYVGDDSLAIDQQRLVHPGNEGVLRKRHRIRFEDGVEVERRLEDQWQASAAQNRVIAFGRKIEPLTLETPDGPITYWRKMRVYTTAYSPARSGTPPSAPWYGRTRIGLPLTKGLVAVDPSIIAMRSQMYIPGYGIGLAADTGGGVKGRFVDLGYDDANYQSWHWWTDIYLLWPPPPAFSIPYILPNYPRFPDRRR
jgi:uncharacterized protein YabE (DUF348 family)